MLELEDEKMSLGSHWRGSLSSLQAQVAGWDELMDRAGDQGEGDEDEGHGQEKKRSAGPNKAGRSAKTYKFQRKLRLIRR